MLNSAGHSVISVSLGQMYLKAYLQNKEASSDTRDHRYSHLIILLLYYTFTFYTWLELLDSVCASF